MTLSSPYFPLHSMNLLIPKPERYCSFLMYLLCLLPLLPSAQAASRSSHGNTTDHLALLSFKSLLSSTTPPGKVLTSWNDTVSYCMWPGVTCSKQPPGRVTALNLESLGLTGTISPYLVNLTFLEVLHLQDNNLFGHIPPELGFLQNLQVLNLGLNFLEGQIPGTLGRCSDLREISLNQNKLHGEIPSSLSNCSKLQFIALTENNLTGRIPPSFGNLSSLEALILPYNSLEGDIPAELGQVAGLAILDLQMNLLSGKIPSILFNLSSLYVLALGGNFLSGSLPLNFGQYLPSLSYLYMYDNLLEGPIPLSIASASALQVIELTNNKFSGIVPPHLGTIPDLTRLLLADNLLEARGVSQWTFIASLTNCTKLKHLDLSNNNFQGLLPDSIGNLSNKMESLILRNNNLTGRIPPGIGNLTNLLLLDMECNSLSGPIPDTFGKLLNLAALSVRGNELSGVIPSSMGNLTKMNELYLSKNSLSGSVPETFASFQELSLFDISHNNLSGAMSRSVVGISSISTFFNISHNSFVGDLPEEVGRLVRVKTIDVSYNNFSGNIPISLGRCLSIEYLNLQGNNFTGTVPEQLNNLKGILMLDLSQNQLSGPIPKFLETMSSLQFLNLSFNDFWGEVPTGGIFSNSSLFSISGNKNLCGGHPALKLRACSVKKHGLSTTALVVSIVVPCSLLLLLSLFCACKYVRRKISRESPELTDLANDQFPRLSYADLQRATNGFSSANLIGVGGFGSVYRGYLEQDRKEVAVKVLNQQVHEAAKSFMSECKVLRTIKHRNLVGIVTACSTIDFNGNEFKALVYDFMPNGSLQMWLHTEANSLDDHAAVNSRRGSLNLLQRLNIAIDVALALDYLHNETQVPIVHCDLKPSNILLEDDMTAKVSDFGIARFVSTNSDTISTGMMGSIGYVAPERGMGSLISTQWDVYSFGVLLLEIFTGKSPTDELLNGLSLHKYVEKSFPERISKILAPELLLEEGKRISGKTYECLASVIGIALACSKEAPGDRMEMKDILKQLKNIRCATLEVDGHREIEASSSGT